MAEQGAARRVGRPARVDRQMIIDAAIAVGFDHLSMPLVGQHLAVSHAALYSYVKDRDELVSAAIDGLFAAEDWPRYDGDWRAYLTAVGLQFWHLLDRHRGLAYALEGAGRAPRPEGYASFLRNVRSSLIDAGFEPVDAITIASMVMDQALAFHRGGKDEHGDSLTVLEARHFLGQRNVKNLRGVDDRTRQALANLLAMPPLEWFQRRLDLLLDAAESRHG